MSICSSNPGFLTLSTLDILSQIIFVVGGCLVHYSMFSSIPGLFTPVYASGTHKWQSKMSPECPLRGQKSLPVENHCFTDGYASWPTEILRNRCHLPSGASSSSEMGTWDKSPSHSLLARKLLLHLLVSGFKSCSQKMWVHSGYICQKDAWYLPSVYNTFKKEFFCFCTSN